MFDSARALWASFCFRSVTINPEANLYMRVFVLNQFGDLRTMSGQEQKLVLSYVCAHLCRRVCLKCRVYNYATGGRHPAGFQARSKDLRGGRWSWTLKLAQKRSWVGRWSWAKSWTSFAWVVQVVRQQQCNEHCLCDSVQTQQLKQQLRSAQVAGQWRGDTSIVLAAVHSLSGLFRAVSAVEPFTLSSPSHSVPSPNRPSRLRGRKARKKRASCLWAGLA